MTLTSSNLTKIIGIVLLVALNPLSAEERNLQALMQWDGDGTVYSIGTNQMLFLGSMDGILYVENEKGDIDGAFVECPISQKINLETGEAVATGYCQISVSPGDVVYAELDCKGVVGDCKGYFRLVEGVGNFEGIKGGSDLRIRSVLGALVKGMASGSVVRSGQGIALLPNLKFTTPD
ncbi:MAG: hypothetical protein ABGY96_20670 [bacterium]|nr:hypothetical protein [Gammaproteobacteria bacterium]HIL96350.1 hypothetical protein [Pseudomonadales bacterium]